MRCQQARARLCQYLPEPNKLAGDTELMAHLNDCPACQLLVEAEASLKAAFTELSQRQITPAPYFDAIVTRVEALAAESSKPTSIASKKNWKEITIMSKIAKQLSRRPSLSVSIGLIGILLVVSMVVPFTYQDSIGYEVAFAGVDKELALDSEKLNELLIKLGVGEAVIDVSGCEATCNVKISEIPSSKHARLVVAAFEAIGNSEMTEQPKAVFESKDGNVFFGMLHEITEYEEHDNVNLREFHEEDLREIVIDLLGGEAEVNTIWISKCEPGTERTIDIFKGDCNQLVIGNPDDQVMKFVYLGLADSTCDPSKLDSLHAAGCSLVVIQECLSAGGHVYDTYESESDNDAAAKESSLPDGYTLAQNYPNPFNPETRIGFSIAQAGQVTLHIYNIKGEVVKRLVDGYMSAGDHEISWDATNSNGEPVGTGIYLYRLTAGEVTTTKKMNLVK